MRDLEARQVRRYAPVGPAVVVTPNDAEVRGDVQLLLRVVADDIVDRQVAVVGRRRECRRAAFDVEVRERTRARGRTAFAHVEDVTRSGRRRCIVAGVSDPSMVHVVGIRIDRAWESRRRSRVVDPVPRRPSAGSLASALCVTKTRPADVVAQSVPWSALLRAIQETAPPGAVGPVDGARQVTALFEPTGPPSG